MTDAGTNRQEIATAGKARLAMTGWWTDCGRKVVGTMLFGQKGSPFRSVHRGRAVAKIKSFLGGGNEYCIHNSARLEGSGEVALIAGAINSNPPQPASLVSFLPEQERYPPEELHLQIPQRVSFSTQMLAITTVIARGRIATPVCGLARNDRGIRWIQQPTNRRLPRHFVARNDRGFRWILQPTDREEQPLT